jgi:hypothetical protein
MIIPNNSFFINDNRSHMCSSLALSRNSSKDINRSPLAKADSSFFQA